MPTQYDYKQKQPNRTISITGFGGKAIGLPSRIDPVEITGTFQEYARTTYSNQPVLEHAIITITRDQEIPVGTQIVTLALGKTYELKSDGVGYKLFNDIDHPLTVTNSTIRTGGRRTNRRKQIRKRKVHRRKTRRS